MAVTKEQRRAAFVALSLLASAGGGYVAKDDLMAIGKRYCGPVPTAIIEKLDGTRMPATLENIASVNQGDGQGVKIKLQLTQATGFLAAWCDPDRQQITDDVDLKIVKGDTQ